MKINLQNKFFKEYDSSVKAIDIAKDISEGFARNVLGVKVNGELKDITTVISSDSNLEFVKFDDEEGKNIFWHTSTHIMAQAIKRLFPNAKLGTGPAVENGFYYDIDLEEKITPEVIDDIEKEFKKIVSEGLEITREEISKQDAIKLFTERNEPYKLEIIESIEEGATISIYRQGEFVDLCSGPHLTNTKLVKAFKVTNIAGAYWRADANNKQLQRVYGVSFDKKSKLDEYLKMLEEAKLRDHRKIGKEMDLFVIKEEGPGFPFFLPKGTMLKNLLMEYWREVHREAGYVEIETPIILNRHLWETSGHWFNYKENMYTVKIDDEDYAIKPMNCPGCMLVYDNSIHSYKELPLRIAEVGRVHRHELSGALHGLMRVRAFTQDDSHIFMLPEQIKDEIKGVARLIDKVYKTFGFEYHMEISTRPEKYMGEIEDWDKAEAALKEALEEENLPYIINEGDGAFYGPKIDFHLKDCIGRTWQCGTIQLDYQMPERFELTYVGKDGEKHRPIMIHRVVFGSIERFIGILIEHFAGKFPLWLAPVQVKVLPISDKYLDYANKVKEELYKNGIRVELDDRAEKIGYKIRQAQMEEKVPYMVIIGEQEQADQNISVRARDKGDLGSKNLQDFIDEIIKKTKNRDMEI